MIFSLTGTIWKIFNKTSFMLKAGVTKKIREDVFPLERIIQNEKLEPLRFNHIIGPMVLWMIGLLVAFLVFCVEKTCHRLYG